MKKTKKRKLNKNGIFFVFVMSAYLISLLFFTSSILVLEGIETFIRLFILILLYLFLVLYLIIGLNCIVGKRKKLFTIISIVMLVFVPIFSIGSFYINKTFSEIGKINKTKITYSTSLISETGTIIRNNSSVNIGMISDEHDIEGYILAHKLLEKEALDKVNIEYYDDYTIMLNDLHDKKLQGVLISSNYSIMFGEDETLEWINSTKPIYSYSEEREKDEAESTNKSLDKPFSILLIGVDSVNPKMNANQSFNGDTLMVLTFNPNTLNATMFSIPRDTYTTIACKNRVNKINTSAYYGTKCVIDTVEKFVDIDIDYYVKINFKGVVALVDALGGVAVDVPYSFCEQNSNREFGSSTVYVEKGMQRLSGEQALALARNRKGWPGYCASKWNLGVRNDFVRGQNQQLVVTGIAKEIKNIRSVPDFYDIIDAVSSNIDTNITTNQLLSFYEVAKNILMTALSSNDDFITIERTYLTGYDLKIDGRYTFQYYDSSLKAIVEAMKYNLELEEPDHITTFDFSVKETYEKSVIGRTYSSTQPKIETLPNFVGKTKAEVQAWANSKSIAVVYQNVSVGNNLFDETKGDDVIVSQSVRATTLLDKITTVTFYVNQK